MERDWSIRSGDGNVRLILPEGFAAILDASASDGRIDSEQPITLEGSSSKNRLIGRLSNGGYRLRIQTGDGNINIRKS
jgi:subtilisin-like proprotein convertase family protein